MIKFAIVFLSLLFLGCSGIRKEEKKTTVQQVDNMKISGTTFIEKRKNGIINDWVIKDNFNADTILLTLLDSSTNKTSNVLTFNKDRSVRFWEYNSKPSCGNGIYYLDSTSFWTRNTENGNLILSLDGGIYMYETFHRKIEYHLDTTQFNQLVLIKSKVYYDKHQDSNSRINSKL